MAKRFVVRIGADSDDFAIFGSARKPRFQNASQKPLFLIDFVSQHSAWETMMRSHAIANGVFVAAPNRTGIEGNIEFWGASFVSDPNGNILARGAHDREETLLVECDFDRIDVVRTHWPFLRDRRIDAYSDLTRRYID